MDTFSGMRPPRVVEHSAVNRSVVGSSPTGGAYETRKFNVYGFYCILQYASRGQNRPSAGKSRYVPTVHTDVRSRLQSPSISLCTTVFQGPRAVSPARLSTIIISD